MKKILIIFISLCLSVPVLSEETRVYGTVEGKTKGTIRLMMYSDQVSYKKVTLATASIDEQGKFSLSTSLEEITYALIDLDFQTGEIFLVPGEDHELILHPVEDAAKRAYYDRPMLEFTILQENERDVNGQIRRINTRYNEFLLENARLLQSSSRKSVVEGFIQEFNGMVGENADPYLKAYSRYKIASLELSFRTRSSEKLAADHLTGHPVLYHHVEYMDFFHLFFEKYLLTNNLYLPYSKTSSLVNGTFSSREIVDELQKDPVLADPRLAELVLLAGLKEMSSSPGFKPDRITYLLDDIAQAGDYPEHRAIAGNLKEKLAWMKPGSPAPHFELIDVLGGVHSLGDYRGRYIYLSFISLYSPSSLAEMNLLADLYDDHRGRVHFISIIVDDLQPGWAQLVKDYRMNWDLLLAGENPGMIDAYGASAPPIFILIDPEGNIFRYPAPNPSEELRGMLDLF